MSTYYKTAGGSSSSSSGKGRITIDPERLDTCEITIQEIEDIESMITRFASFLDCIIRKCSEGRKHVFGIPVCCATSSSPYLLLKVTSVITHAEITKIVVKKKNLYGYAATLGGTWRCTTDAKFKIEGAIDLPFTSNYTDMKGPDVKSLGLGVLSKTLKTWNAIQNDDHRILGSSYKCIMHNISEVCRFAIFKDMIIDNVRKYGSIWAPVPFDYPCYVWIGNWQLISGALKEFEQRLNKIQEEDKRDAEKVKWENDYEAFVKKMGPRFDTLEKTVRAMGILLDT